MIPPNDFGDVMRLGKQADINFDGKISSIEMFNLFKKIQFKQMGWGGIEIGVQKVVYTNGWDPNVHDQMLRLNI